MPGRDDPYQLLGIAANAGRREITAAYRRRVRELHPDTPGGDAELLAAVVAAYRLLSDDERRAEYDRATRRGTPVRVRVHPDPAPAREPGLRAGPVRYHGPAPRSP